MFGKDVVKLEGQRCGVVGKPFATLKKREAKGQLMVVTIDEFKTSKTCSLRFYGYSWIQGMTLSRAVWYGAGRPDVFMPAKKKKVSP
ncbi:hypothetical protein BDF20DRAFT_998371 [Mycotypha africana]|uniref:uncharacterized protein n=1 Tax=Mycotypha africana TaxID=64632 RepID=UPI0023008135|nr:uncharacterized protein BDF20DRAFT_998371 [Mycotypha africana]KAI8987807.1 hypothetical protein BDF20DRAFT_998371 [Mycotypha africana]